MLTQQAGGVQLPITAEYFAPQDIMDPIPED